MVKCETAEHEPMEGQYKMIDGVLCGFFEDGDILYGAGFDVSQDNGFYFEEPEQFKLEVGKCYRTRNGKKVFISGINSDNDYPMFGIIKGFISPDRWLENGKFDISNTEHDLDLISEWSDDDVAED